MAGETQSSTSKKRPWGNLSIKIPQRHPENVTTALDRQRILQLQASHHPPSQLTKTKQTIIEQSGAQAPKTGLSTTQTTGSAFSHVHPPMSDLRSGTDSKPAASAPPIQSTTNPKIQLLKGEELDTSAIEYLELFYQSMERWVNWSDQVMRTLGDRDPDYQSNDPDLIPGTFWDAIYPERDVTEAPVHTIPSTTAHIGSTGITVAGFTWKGVRKFKSAFQGINSEQMFGQALFEMQRLKQGYQTHLSVLKTIKSSTLPNLYNSSNETVKTKVSELFYHHLPKLETLLQRLEIAYKVMHDAFVEYGDCDEYLSPTEISVDHLKESISSLQRITDVQLKFIPGAEMSMHACWTEIYNNTPPEERESLDQIKSQFESILQSVQSIKQRLDLIHAYEKTNHNEDSATLIGQSYSTSSTQKKPGTNDACLGMLSKIHIILSDGASGWCDGMSQVTARILGALSQPLPSSDWVPETTSFLTEKDVQSSATASSVLLHETENAELELQMTAIGDSPVILIDITEPENCRLHYNSESKTNPHTKMRQIYHQSPMIYRDHMDPTQNTPDLLKDKMKLDIESCTRKIPINKDSRYLVLVMSDGVSDNLADVRSFSKGSESCISAIEEKIVQTINSAAKNNHGVLDLNHLSTSFREQVKTSQQSGGVPDNATLVMMQIEPGKSSGKPN